MIKAFIVLEDDYEQLIDLLQALAPDDDPIAQATFREAKLLLSKISINDEMFMRACNEERMIGVMEAAEIMGRHRVFISTLIRQGRLPATKVGRNYKIKPSDLAKLTDVRKRNRK